MKAVELYARVRRACHVEGMSQRQAAREFGIDPKTVAKMLRFSVPPGYRRSKPPVRPKLNGGVVQNRPVLGHTGARRAPACAGRMPTFDVPVREAPASPASSPPGLKRSQAEQGEPVRMALAGHQLPRALALALGVPAA